MNEIEFRMEWPVGLGRYYRAIKNRFVISKAGREYRDKVVKIVKENNLNFGIDYPVEIVLKFAPPRSIGIEGFDIDNFKKALFDAFTHAGVWMDDKLVYKDTSEKAEAYALGQVYITIMKYENR